MKLPALLIASAFVAVSGASFAGPGEDLIAAEKCNKCHTATTTKKAPSFGAIAEKHKGKADAPAKLATMLKTGVPLSGKTGEDDLHKKVAASDDAIKAAVAVVLSSK